MRYSVQFEVEIDKNGWKRSSNRPILTARLPLALVTTISVPITAEIIEIKPVFVPGYYRSLIEPKAVHYFERIAPLPGEWERVQIKVDDNA